MNEYRFLKDKPIGEDLFESGSHKKVAHSIIDLIEENNEKMIGLEGEWGSGKSNVIEIIKHNLKDTHYMFVYDAWGHQEDLQRRSFLEELTSDICNLDVENKDYWENELEGLLARKTRNTTKTIPKLNDAFLVLTITLFLNSRFNKIPNEAIKSIIPDNLEVFLSSIITNDFLKCILLEIPKNFPLLATIIIWVYIKIKKHKKNNEEYNGFKTVWNDLRELLYLYKEKELEKTVDTITSTKEPSVTEFKGWMDNLSKKLDEKKLIIVFDNMDRLPKDKVKELWSSIHTFFSEHSYENIWTIVPFDRKHIKEAFENKGSENTNDSNNFIGKTFSIIYRISPPVATDWKSFFDIKIIEAFPNIDDKESALIRSLYDLESEDIKPRNIILFFNEMISLKKVWKEEIPLEYIAIFVLKKKEILEDPLNEILTKNFIKRSIHLFNNEVEDYISALVYNVPVKKASQILLARDIELSLREKHVDNIKKLSMHGDFYKILENTVNNVENIENTILTLAEILDESNQNQAIKEIIWMMLTNKFYKYEIKEIDFKEFFKIIILKSSNNINKTFKYIVGSFAEQSRIYKISGEDFYATVTKIEMFISENKNIPVNWEEDFPNIYLQDIEFIKFISLAKEKYSKYKVFANWDKIEEYYINKLNGKFDDDLDLSLIKYFKDAYGFNLLKNEIENKLKSGLDINNMEAIYKLHFIFLEKPTNLRWDFNSLLSTISLFNDQNTDKFYILCAILISYIENEATMNNMNSNYRNRVLQIMNLKDNDFVEGISNYIQYFISFGEILEKVVTLNKPLINNIAKYLITNKYGTSELNIIEIIYIFDDILNNITIEPEIFVDRLDSWFVDLEKGINDKNIFETIKSEQFLLGCKKLDNETSKYIKECYKLNILNRSSEEIQDELKDEKLTYFTKVLKTLIETGIILKLSNNLTDAYKHYLKEVTRESYIVSKDKIELLNLMYGAADKRQLKTTFKDIRDLFINTYNINNVKFLLFAPMLQNHAELNSRSSDVVRRIIIPIVNDGECLRYILKNKEYFITIINNSEESKIDLLELLNKKIEENNDSIELKKFMNEINDIKVEILT